MSDNDANKRDDTARPLKSVPNRTVVESHPLDSVGMEDLNSETANSLEENKDALCSSIAKVSDASCEDNSAKDESETSKPDPTTDDGDDGSIQYWCSWCFKRSDHEMIVRNWTSRNVNQCLNCHRLTAKCITCKQMARAHSHNDVDKLCAKCDRTVEVWGTFPQSVTKQGYCSWCFDLCEHRILQKTVVTRNSHQCQGCGNTTVICLRCSQAFCRSYDGSHENYCALCNEMVESWETAKTSHRVVLSTRWCSWCFEQTNHVLEKSNLVQRDTYKCDACQSITVTCSEVHCEDMARSGVGWFDSTCAYCEGKVQSWKTLQQIKNKFVTQYRNPERVMAEMSRSSAFRKKAAAAGLLRPFLLLVGMNPSLRCQLAACLGWTLLVDPCVGDPHAESWEILMKKKKGIVALTRGIHENVNPFANDPSWYTILYRLLEEIIKKVESPSLSVKEGIQESKTNISATMDGLETEFLKRVAQLQWRNMTDRQREDMERERNSEEGKRIVTLLKNAGVKDETVLSLGVEIARQYLSLNPFSALVFSLGVIGHAGFPIVALVATNLSLLLTPLAIVGWAMAAHSAVKLMFGPSFGRVFPVVMRVMQQRLILALESMPLEEFYQDGE